MNYINDGDYYFVALYSNGERETIDLNKKWYYGDENVIQTAVDIAAIDLITTRFPNIEVMKKRMYEKGYIKSSDADLFIAHKNKYNDKQYIAEHELIFNNNERKKLITALAYKRLNNEAIVLNDVNNFLNKFLTKSFYTESFHRFITSPWCKLDSEIKNQLLTMNNNKNEKLKNDPNTKVKPPFNVKYRYLNRFTSYINIRNIVYNWDLYDSLVEEYKKTNPDSTDVDMAKGIIDNYLENSKIQMKRKNVKDVLMPMVDKKNVKGQISIADYMNNKDQDGQITGDTVKPAKSEYDIVMDAMYEEANRLKNTPFEDSRLIQLEQKFGRRDVIEHLSNDILQTIDTGDRYRLGLIDFVAYKNEMRNNNGKGCR